MMNLLTRLIGIHKLIVLGYYDFIIPYLKPAQQQVTRILAYTAQASHDLVPPDVIAPVVQAVADNFIWGNCSSEVVCAGMNGLREIVARCPLSMSESLLQSLMADYKNHKEKGVMMASRSLLGLFREINPELLKKRDRGKNASIALQSGVFSAPQYGHVKVSSTLAGLEEEEEEERGGGGEEEDGDEGWDDEEDDGEQQGDDDLDQLLDGLSELGSEDFEEFQEDSDLEEVAEEEEEEMEGEDEEKKVSLTNTTAVRKSKKLSSQMAYEKILTDEDFKRLRKQQRGDDNDNGNQSSDDSQEGSDSDSSEEEEEEEDNRPGDIVDEGVITSGIKRKMDYAARMESIMAGREGREKFGSKKSKTERSSITNKVKSKKNKAFMMMVHKRSVKGKAKRSLRDKQVNEGRGEGSAVSLFLYSISFFPRKFCDSILSNKRRRDTSLIRYIYSIYKYLQIYIVEEKVYVPLNKSLRIESTKPAPPTAEVLAAAAIALPSIITGRSDEEEEDDVDNDEDEWT